MICWLGRGTTFTSPDGLYGTDWIALQSEASRDAELTWHLCYDVKTNFQCYKRFALIVDFPHLRSHIFVVPAANAADCSTGTPKQPDKSSPYIFSDQTPIENFSLDRRLYWFSQMAVLNRTSYNLALTFCYLQQRFYKCRTHILQSCRL